MQMKCFVVVIIGKEGEREREREREREPSPPPPLLNQPPAKMKIRVAAWFIGISLFVCCLMQKLAYVSKI